MTTVPAARPRSWWCRLRPFALALVLLLSVELLVGLLPVPRQRLEEILEILELHPTRLWAVKADLSTRFEGAPLHTDAQGWRTCPPAGTSVPLTVCCLGDSLTFGWGVGDEAPWPAQLARTFGARVLNLSVPGYTTWQGLDIVQGPLPALRPDVVVLAYGVNDVSKLRFFASNTERDSEQRARRAFDVAFWNVAMGTHIYQFLRNQAFRAREGSLDARCQVLRLCEKAPPRVSPDEYTRNIEGMIARARALGAVVVLLKLPLHLPLPPVISEADREAARAHFARAVSLRAGGDLAGSTAEYRAGFDADPLDRARCWEAMEVARKAGDTAGSAHVLELMQKQEVYDSSARHVDYNRLVERVAERTSALLVDAERDLAAAGGADDLYNHPVRDPYHPNERGHRIIAQAVARALRDCAPRPCSTPGQKMK